MDTAKKLISAVNLDYPALSAAKAAYDAGDEAECARQILLHFRTRTAPNYLFRLEDLRRNQDPGLLEDAEQVMRDTLYGYTFPDGIDWHFNPTDEGAHDNE